MRIRNHKYFLILLLFVGCKPASNNESIGEYKTNYSKLDFKEAFNLFVFQENDSVLSTLEDSISFYSSGHLISSFVNINPNSKRIFRTQYYIEDIGCYSERNLFHVSIPSNDEYEPKTDISMRFIDHYLNYENLDSLSEKKLVEVDTIGEIWVPKLTVYLEINSNPRPSFKAVRASIKPILDSYSLILEKNALAYFGTNYLDLNRKQKRTVRKTAPLQFRFDFNEPMTLSETSKK